MQPLWTLRHLQPVAQRLLQMDGTLCTFLTFSHDFNARMALLERSKTQGAKPSQQDRRRLVRTTLESTEA